MQINGVGEMNVVGIIIARGCRTSTIHARCQTLITAGAPIKKKALETLSFLNRKKKALYVFEGSLTSATMTEILFPLIAQKAFGMSIDC